MDLRKFKLENLPPLTQFIIFAVLAGGIAAAFYYFYLTGPIDELAALRTEVSQLEVSVAQGTAVMNKIAQFKRELADLEERLNVLRAILPAQKETPIVLRSVQQMAASSDLKILRFTPQTVIPRVFYSDWPINMEVQGSYDGLGLFFEKVSQSTRIINVDNINIKGIEGATSPAQTLRAVCTATTFVFREDVVTATPK